ncbi:MAG: hypothetical protein WCT37_04175 [Patescibacteria group bacterium]|jgi:hypothetical protein
MAGDIHIHLPNDSGTLVARYMARMKVSELTPLRRLVFDHVHFDGSVGDASYTVISKRRATIFCHVCGTTIKLPVNLKTVGDLKAYCEQSGQTAKVKRSNNA